MHNCLKNRVSPHIKNLIFNGAIACCLVCLNLFSCQVSKENKTDTEENESPSKPLKVIFDTDMGSDCDDVGALALLHAYADLDKVEILGCIYSSGKVPYGAGIIAAINQYYGRSNIAIGANYDTLVGDPVDKMGAERLAKDTLSFGHNIIYNTDAEEQTYLNRRLLVEQEDNSIIYITVGHTKGLYDLLVSRPDSISPLSGRELITKKMSHWVALGALKANNVQATLKKDWNFFFNGSAPFTEYLVKKFPKAIYFINGGGKVLTGKSLEKTPVGNIVRRAYTDWLWNHEEKRLSDQRPSWDLLTVYYAIEGLEPYFEMEEEGWLELDATEGCVWRKGENNFQHHYVSQKPDIDSSFAHELNEYIAKPPNSSKTKKR